MDCIQNCGGESPLKNGKFLVLQVDGTTELRLILWEQVVNISG